MSDFTRRVLKNQIAEKTNKNIHFSKYFSIFLKNNRIILNNDVEVSNNRQLQKNK